MEENRALQVSHQTREMIETGAQAMIQQAITYLQDALHAQTLRKENVQLCKEVVELKLQLGMLTEEKETIGRNWKQGEAELDSVRTSRDIIAQHRDNLMKETAQLSEKLRRIRHSMDTMRGIMDSNLAA